MRRYVAIDLGAESGRVILGTLRGARVELEEMHRFANAPVRLPDGLHTDVVRIYAEVLVGLQRAASATGGRVDGIGIDAWGVDFGLLDGDGCLLGIPFHYRDSRTEGMVERLVELAGREEVYETTGIGFNQINTVCQLLAMQGTPALAASETLLLTADLIGYWLTGQRRAERTAASTTQLLDARTGAWAWKLIDRLGLDRRLFPPIAETASIRGPLLAGVAADCGLDPGTELVAVGQHDTASAVAAVPATSDAFAYISSGTWSLVGIETDEPVTDATALAMNLTNERGVPDTVRLMTNVMGLWLVQECRRAWNREGRDLGYGDLAQLATASASGGPLVDPDHPTFLSRGSMPARIAALCLARGQAAPDSPGATVRCVLESLACKYRLALERVEHAVGRRSEVVHVVGGGSRNVLLCQLTADVLGRVVHAGPVEATALGNVLTQALARGHIASLQELRVVAASSAQTVAYEPRADRAGSDQLYERFLTVTGLEPANHRNTKKEFDMSHAVNASRDDRP
ncbi:MAG: Carbohydrate kinase, FGGY-like protein [Conexibacter sp.]|nr:Carbohydrate kinase, FGGY-like protein [Conexibacter sp.]